MVALDNCFIFHVMAFHAPLEWIFQLVELGFQRSRLAGLVDQVAGIAPGIQGGMPAPLFRYIQTGCMTFQAEIFGLAPGKGLQCVISVFGRVRIMALQATARGWRMYRTLAGNGLLILVALQANGTGGSSFQLDADSLPGDPNHMTGKATDGNSRMHRTPVCLFLMAFQAFSRIRIFLQRGRMLGSLKGNNTAGCP